MTPCLEWWVRDPIDKVDNFILINELIKHGIFPWLAFSSKTQPDCRFSTKNDSTPESIRFALKICQQQPENQGGVPYPNMQLCKVDIFNNNHKFSAFSFDAGEQSRSFLVVVYKLSCLKKKKPFVKKAHSKINKMAGLNYPETGSLAVVILFIAKSVSTVTPEIYIQLRSILRDQFRILPRRQSKVVTLLTSLMFVSCSILFACYVRGYWN